MKTHSGDPPGESEYIGSMNKDDKNNDNMIITIT